MARFPLVSAPLLRGERRESVPPSALATTGYTSGLPFRSHDRSRPRIADDPPRRARRRRGARDDQSSRGPERAQLADARRAATARSPRLVETRASAWSSSPARGRSRSSPAPTSTSWRSRARRAAASTRFAASRCSISSSTSASRRSPRSTATRSAAAASWRWRARCGSRPTRPSSASRRSTSGSFPGTAARSVWPRLDRRRPRRSSCS